MIYKEILIPFVNQEEDYEDDYESGDDEGDSEDSE